MVFKWLHPEWLWLGPALFAATIISAVIFHRWRSRVWNLLGLHERGSHLAGGSMSVARFYTRHTVLALALLFLGLSLANLQMGGQKQKVQRKGADVVFALDVSRSMLAEDLAPSRLDKAKLLISRTIDQLGGDRVGIIAYAGSAYPALPITTDYAAAKMALIAADPDAAPNQGTNLAAALEYAWGYFNPASPAGRFVVVLTDGEDHEELSRDILPDFPVETILIGVGTPQGGPIPVSKSRNGTTYKKDKNGDVVITRRDESTLAKIGQTLGSAYIDGNRTESALASIENLLEAGTKADIQEEVAIDYDDQFSWFLMPAVLFLLLYLVLPGKAGNPWSKAALWIAIFISPSAFAQEQNSELENASSYQYQQKMQEGKEADQNFNYGDAARAYADAAMMRKDAFEPMYNLGNSLLKMGETEQALGALSQAYEKAQTELDRSDAAYNLGNALYASEKYEEAIKAYKKSLAEQPRRKDAQYNLSRAMEKLQQQQQQQNQDKDQDQQDQDEQQDKSDNDQDDPMDENDQNEDSKKDQDQQDQSNDGQGEQDQKDQQQNQDNQNPQDDEGDQDKNKPEEGGQAKAKMSPEEIKGLLEAIQRAEQKTAEKVSAKQAKGTKSTGEKDW